MGDMPAAGQGRKGNVGPGEDGRNHDLWRQHNTGILARLQLAPPRRNALRVDVGHLEANAASPD
eukprot:2864618-Pyramimonas_sp.AAC.1